MRRLLFCLWLIAASAGAEELRGYDVFGVDQLQYDYRPRVEALLRLAEDQRAQAILALSEEIKRQHGFAWTRISLIRYFGPKAGYYATVDVVRQAEQLPAVVPATPYWFAPDSDPGGLFKSWEGYQAEGYRRLAAGGAFHQHDDSCPVHCLHGFSDPALQVYRARFYEDAVAHRGALRRAFMHSRSAFHRGLAAFLLVHLVEPEELVELLSSRLLDESSFVRNDVARVFAGIAERRAQLELPVQEVLTLLEFPETTDRNKAAAVVHGLLARPGGVERYGELVRARSGEVLLRMLRLEQPNNHDYAYLILKRLAGQDLGERNYEAWEAWLAQP